MKVAIVHDWLVTNAGAEKVLQALLEIYPQADVFSLVDFLNYFEREQVLQGKHAHTSFIQKLPFAQKYFRNYLPFFPKAIESFDLNGYDVIISSSWAFAKGIKRDNKQLHISYCHTPIRYAWDLYEEYTAELHGLKKLLVAQTLKNIRTWDVATLDRVDYFVANSRYVQERIHRIYKKDAVVIYPPVDIEKFTCVENKEDFYLTASRLVPYKKIDLIVEAFAKIDRKLVVVGDGPQMQKIKEKAGKNVEVLGYQPDEILLSLMQKAKAFVFAAVEDFGITPVEAQACGTPVICLGEGGTKETVIDMQTGVHFHTQSSEAIIEAIEKFEKNIDIFKLHKIRENALKFSKKRFQKEIEEFIIEKLEKI
ncbi:glycosyltransferase family 4 protein [Nitratiruptor sp. YY09-18]|uniref:glycosyltransferase family 4 protein n=1 Tax=Nitratiruptor sp. YY09-18 TaxID=2724901 RepID=UPI00193570E7|nr:glycosyl transferase [Nitratiruptor sp. YY09-18]